ncbi:MAG: response regulator [Lachnospiraceae bacterium]|nr:response regulator [Lachnospiraceae bacterium]MDY3224159.1 response regulator [Lachnospiraceae bacterium]
MKIIALDDEELALEGLMDAIRKAAPDAELKGFSYAEDVLEFIKDHTCDVAFLDVEMVGLNGVALAEQLKICNPDINIIFATGFSCYREAAFDLHASGYLMKPITEAKVKKELENLRRPVPKQRRIRVRCFGNFEVWLDGAPMKFKYDLTKELLAYLIDRKGSLCTNGEIVAALFEDDNNHDAYLRSLRKDLLDTLEEAGCSDVIVRQRGKLGVLPEAIGCDYYDWCAGKQIGNTYRGEYMMQYSWSEYTNAILCRTR